MQTNKVSDQHECPSEGLSTKYSTFNCVSGIYDTGIGISFHKTYINVCKRLLCVMCLVFQHVLSMEDQFKHVFSLCGEIVLSKPVSLTLGERRDKYIIMYCT